MICCRSDCPGLECEGKGALCGVSMQAETPLPDLQKLEEEVHLEGCKFNNAVTGIAIECEHGYDVCPKCDPCTCALINAEAILAST